jgi:hypothetical protein
MNNVQKEYNRSKVALKKSKAPKDYTVEEVLDMVKEDINDFSQGWVSIQSPQLTKIKRGKMIESSLTFKVALYNASEKTFKITVTEVE